jgi:NAD+ diphosphatase
MPVMSNFISSIHAPDKASASAPEARWFIFYNEEVLLYYTPEAIRIPYYADLKDLGLEFSQQHYLGLHHNTPCFAARLASPPPAIHSSTTLKLQKVRQSYSLINNEDLFLVIARAMQILYWDKRTQFCGCCGSQTEHHAIERAKICPACKTLFFPQISPAMLVLIKREDKILLARSPDFLPGIYSTLAGFIEPGETVEQAVIREVKEEVGISIKNLQYVASQPWSFPSNLMLGFTAEYAEGEIQINQNELEDAQWFSIHQLPQLPNPMSLSRQMVDHYVKSFI